MKYTWKVGYLKAILVASCLIFGAMLAYNSLVVYPSFNEMLTRNTEEEAVRVARFLMSEVLDERNPLEVDNEASAKIMDALDQFRLWKLKIFSADGETVYSTNQSEIGTFNDSSIFSKELPAGRILSKVVRKDAKSSEGEPVPLDITETYIPIFDGEGFAGAFEIYYDITKRKARQDQNLRHSTLVSVSIALLFFGVLIFILVSAGMQK